MSSPRRSDLIIGPSGNCDVTGERSADGQRMAARTRVSVRRAVLDFLKERRPAIVDLETLNQIRRYTVAVTGRAKPPSSEYLLDILLETEVPVDRAIGGIPPDLRGKVRTGNLDVARQSLLELAREYAMARDPGRASDVRRAVMRTKTHLKLALARGIGPRKRAVKQEIFEWLLVWLENPGIFEPWLDIRERRRSGQSPAPHGNRPNGKPSATT